MKKLLTLILLSAASSAFAAQPYVGASAGYWIDSEEAYFAARIGTSVAQTTGLTHNVEVEVGFTSLSGSGIDFDMLPVMANYRLVSEREQSKFGFYAGAGLGATRLDVSGFGLSDDNWGFSVQAFGGVEYKVAPKVALTAGVRYLWIDDTKFFGTSTDVGDDVGVEVGVRFRF
jgi:opacity protein-like surface antigen